MTNIRSYGFLNLQVIYFFLSLFFLGQFSFSVTNFCDQITRSLFFVFCLGTYFFLKTNNSSLSKYIASLFLLFAIPRFLLVSLAPKFVIFPLNNIDVTIINKGLVIFLASSFLLYFGIFTGNKIMPIKEFKKNDRFDFSISSIVLSFFLIFAVEFYLTHFIGLSPYTFPSHTLVSQMPSNTFYQLLRIFAASDIAVFLVLIVFFNHKSLRDSKKCRICIGVIILAFVILTALGGSRSGGFRIAMELFVIFMTTKKSINLNFKKLIYIFLALFFLNIISFFVGNLAREKISQNNKYSIQEIIASPNSNSKQSLQEDEGFLGIVNRLSIVDYAIVLPYAPRKNSELLKYTNLSYIAKSTINLLVPGIIYQESSLNTSRVINIIFRGYSSDYVSKSGYFSEYWTSYSLLFLIFGIGGIIAHFFLGFTLQICFSFLSNTKSVWRDESLTLYTYFLVMLTIFTMGIDHSILTFIVTCLQIVSSIMIYLFFKFFLSFIKPS